MRFIFVLAVFFSLIADPNAATAQAPGLIRRDTTIRSFDGRETRGEVLELTVPERHARPLNKLKVGALRLPATTATPGKPIVFLMGGPGIPGSVMTPIPPYFTLFQKLRELGDVIIVDQRGIGLSTPHLDCNAKGSLPADAFVSTARLVAFLRDQVAICAAVNRSRKIEPTAYNTVESAHDVDALRKALKLDKIDILAFSYGTRWALAIADRHPASVGRMVLQGVNGPGLVAKRPSPVARKLSRITTLLKADSAWSPATDLAMSARNARARLKTSPAIISITDKRAGRETQVTIGKEGFDAIVALNLDDLRLPALITSVAQGDDRLLTRFVEAGWNGLTTSPVALMARAVNCAADRPQSRWTLIESESTTAPFGEPIDNAFLRSRFCASVGFIGKTTEFAQPLRTSIPTLLLTGALDATNPIENANDVALRLTNSISLEIGNAAHEALPITPVQEAIVDFLKGVNLRGRTLSAPVPHFPALAEALQAPARPR
ncbi:MAG TPA: alpha/beta fold hydrolase [Gemmatimonadaceae bacterium]|nr:alpha/beta fold hydrolase [Gemmatimonadaceae bacterium]